MSPANPMPSINRRRALTALAVGVVAPGALAACVGKTSETSEAPTAPSAPSLKFEPAKAAADVSPTAPVGVEVSDGWLQRVALTNPEGKVVAGSLNRDRTAFNVTEPLGYGVEYTWAGSVVGRDGKAIPLQGSFSTISPDTRVNGQFQLADGQVVGVAAPIIIQFDASISDKASVEKALKVTTDQPVEGSWAWLPDEVGGSRVHWRTRDYYPAGTKVHVDAKLYGTSLRRRRLRRGGLDADVRDRPPPGGQGRGLVAPHPGARRAGRRHHGLPVQLRRRRPGPQRHPQRCPCRHREVRRLLHDQPGRGLRQCPRAFRGADLQQRRVHPRQPGQLRRAGQHQRDQRLHQPVRVRRPAVLQQRDLRRSGRGDRDARSSCPTPTATSGTGPCRGTSGHRCRRCRINQGRPRSPAPRLPRRRVRLSRSTSGPAANAFHWRTWITRTLSAD